MNTHWVISDNNLRWNQWWWQCATWSAPGNRWITATWSIWNGWSSPWCSWWWRWTTICTLQNRFFLFFNIFWLEENGKRDWFLKVLRLSLVWLFVGRQDLEAIVLDYPMHLITNHFSLEVVWLIQPLPLIHHLKRKFCLENLAKFEYEQKHSPIIRSASLQAWYILSIASRLAASSGLSSIILACVTDRVVIS